MNRHMVSCLVLFGLPAAWYGGIGHRRFAAIEGSQATLAAAYARAEQASLEAAGIADLGVAEERLHYWTDQLQPHLQRKDGQPELLLAAQNTLKRHGLQIEQVENLPGESGIGRPNARIQATVSGSMGQLFAALVELENTTPPTRVTNFTWQRQSASATFRSQLTMVQIWQEAP